MSARVPEDVAVVGTGNLDALCQTSLIPLSSIDIRPKEIAQHCADVLERLMNGERVGDKRIILPPGPLVIRRSSDTIAVSHPALRAMMDYLSQRPAGTPTPSVDQLADAAGVSLRQLYKLCRKELNCTPADILCRRRLDRARTLLHQMELDITTIAVRAGYASIRTLNREFHRAEGCSPSEWRRQHAQGG